MLTARFPSAVVTRADIGKFTNNEGVVLASDSAIGQTTLSTEDSPGNLEVDQYLYVLGEDGPVLLQVTAVDANAKTVTVTRPVDGTTDVALDSGMRLDAAIPARALNRLAVEVIALETYMGGDGDTLTWDRNLVLQPSTTDGTYPLTLDILSGHADPEPFINFRRSTDGGTTYTSVGSIDYDPTNDELEFRNITLTAGTAADFLLEDDRSLYLGSDKDARLLYVSADDRVEYQSDKVLRFEQDDGSEALTLTPTTRLNLVGAFSIGGTDVLTSSREVAVSLTPNADNALDLGSPAARWRDIYLGPGSVKVLNAASDANSTTQVDGSGYHAGPGGASALDVLLARQAASLYEVTGSLAGSVRLGMGAAGEAVIALRAAAADTNPYALLDHNGLAFGAGGASATDVSLSRGAADRLDLASGDTLNLVSGAFQIGGTAVFEADRGQATSWVPNADDSLSAGTASRRYSEAHAVQFDVENAAGDANPVARLTTTGLHFGAGGAAATDVLISRGAADRLDLLADDGLFVEGDGADVVLATKDANTGMALRYRDSSGTNKFGILHSPFTDQLIFHGGAAGVTNVMTLANAGTLDLVTGAFRVGGTTVFENDRDLAVNLVPDADGSLSVGTASRRFSEAHAAQFDVENAAGDANPIARLTTDGLHFGAGGASALDVRLFRGAADRLDLAAGDSLRIQSGGLLEVLGTSSFTGDLTLKQTTADTTITWADPAGAQTLTIPDAGGNDSFVLLAAGQTLTNKTLTGATLSGATLSGTTTYTNAGAGADPTLSSNDAAQKLSLVGTLDATSLEVGGMPVPTKSGTPVDNQIAVWTGDGPLEGDAGLTWDGALLTATRSTVGVTASIENSGVDSLAILALKNDAREYRFVVDGGDSDKWQLRDETAAADRVTIDSAGRVGFGTDAPADALVDIEATGQIGLKVNRPEGSDPFRTWMTLQTAGTDRWFFSTDNDSRFIFRRTGSTNTMRIGSGEVSIGSDAGAPAASTVLDLQSTTGALLLPRMTTTQRDALTATNGMVIYNSTTDAVQARVGGAWTDL